MLVFHRCTSNDMARVLYILLCVLVTTISIQAKNGNRDDFYFGLTFEYALYHNGTDNDTSMLAQMECFDWFMDYLGVDPRGNIIVFPEKGLTGIGPIKNEYYMVVPSPEDRIAPCENDTYHEIIRRFSCSTRDNLQYTVVNLPERAPCLSGEDCPERGWFQYNTNVVFDKNGTVIARYRKYHLVDGVDVDVDPAPAQETVIFETDYGVKYLVLTGEDILHPDTYSDVLSKGDVQQIVYPSAWYSALPFHTTVQYQSGWAVSNNVILIASGYSKPSLGYAGGGIFESDHYTSYLMLEYEAVNYIGTVISKSLTETERRRKRSLSREWACERERSKHAKDAEFGLYPGKESLESFESIKLEISDLSGVLEANLSTCFLNGTYSKPDNNQTYLYRLVTHHGANGLEICSLLLCQGPELDDCTTWRENRADGVTFQQISISGDFALNRERDLLMPSTLKDYFVPASYYHFKKESLEGNKTRAMLEWEPEEEVDVLWVFGIYGKPTP